VAWAGDALGEGAGFCEGDALGEGAAFGERDAPRVGTGSTLGEETGKALLSG